MEDKEKTFSLTFKILFMNPSIPPFYVGQEIVAIRDHSQGAFHKGDEFTVTSIRKSCCGWLITIGMKSFCEEFICTHCGESYKNIGERSFCTNLFVPKEQQFKAITYKEVINIESPLISVN